MLSVATRSSAIFTFIGHLLSIVNGSGTRGNGPEGRGRVAAGGELAFQAPGLIGQPPDHRGDPILARRIGRPMEVGLDAPGPFPGLLERVFGFIRDAPR